MLTPYRLNPLGKPTGCRICGQQLSFHQQVSYQICDDWRCKTALLDEEMTAHRALAAGAIGIDQPESYSMVVVPDDPAGTTRPPQQRKQSHINFLYDLCVRVTTVENDADNPFCEPDPDDWKAPVEMASRVCAVCRGTCCHQGKDRAFLDAVAIRRFILTTGIGDPLEISYGFFAYLPEVAVPGGCVYQTDQGCALPRWMRADICNAYRCKGLQQAEQMIGKHDIRRLCVVARKDNLVTRCAFVSDHHFFHYPVPNPDDADLIPFAISSMEA